MMACESGICVSCRWLNLPQLNPALLQSLCSLSQSIYPHTEHGSRLGSEQNRKIQIKKEKPASAEQSVLCYVTAFVARLTHRTVLLQTSVAALFPLTGTIHGTGRDAVRAGRRACVQPTDRQMDVKETEETQTHRRATLCHPLSRCLSGILMARVTDVAASCMRPRTSRGDAHELHAAETGWHERESSIFHRVPSRTPGVSTLSCSKVPSTTGKSYPRLAGSSPG